MGGGLKETNALILVTMLLCFTLGMSIFAYIKENVSYIGFLVGTLAFAILLITGLKERYEK